jgi:hypothetical protein
MPMRPYDNKIKRSSNSTKFGKKAMRHVTNRLREIARHSKMDNASFSGLSAYDRDEHEGVPPGSGKLPLTDEKKVDAFIRSRTSLWRNSWITIALMDLIEEMEDFYPEV